VPGRGCRTGSPHDAQGQQVRHHLSVAANAWDRLGRPDSELYRGVRLAQAVDWRGQSHPDLTPVERAFLDASRQQVDAELHAARARAEREAAARHRTRLLAAGLAAVLMLALVAAGLATHQWRAANRERSVATARELVAAADANLAEDPERSMLLALAAIDETRSSDAMVLAEATEALHRAVTASRVVHSWPGVGGSLDWSPDGSTFVTEGPEDSGLIDIRDANTGDSVRSFHGHDVDVNAGVFSSDGSLLATTGDDGAVRVWDPATGEPISELQDPTWDPSADPEKPVVVVGPSFSPDGSRLAAVFDFDLVRVFDVATGDTIAKIKTRAPTSTAFSPDGKRLAVGDTVVDATSGAELFSLPHTSLDVGWSPDGRWLATAGSDATARIWDADSGEQRFTITGHTARIYQLDWSPDSKHLATVSEDGTARVSEIANGGVRDLYSLSAQDTSHGLGGVAFSPDGQRLMTGDNAITAVKIWDVSPTGGAEWANVPAMPYSSLDFTPDSRGLVVNRHDGAVSVSDIDTGERLATIRPPSFSDVEAGIFDLSDDGQLLATSSCCGPVEVWNVSTGKRRFARSVVDGETTWVQALGWSGGGDLLAIAVNGYERSDGEVVILDRSGTKVAALPVEPGQLPQSVSFSPDGRLLATTRRGFSSFVDPKDKNTRIWDWERRKVVNTLNTFASLAVFDPTGERIATARYTEGMADVWDAQTGDKVATLAAPALVSAIAFSPDGESLATGHDDGTIRLWDTETGTQNMVLPAHGRDVTKVVFSPDGSKLASSDADGLVRVWALDPDDLIAIAHERLTRTLSDAECRQYMHVDGCPDTCRHLTDGSVPCPLAARRAPMITAWTTGSPSRARGRPHRLRTRSGRS
jgi:WD40 repeat protein